MTLNMNERTEQKKIKIDMVLNKQAKEIFKNSKEQEKNGKKENVNINESEKKLNMLYRIKDYNMKMKSRNEGIILIIKFKVLLKEMQISKN